MEAQVENARQEKRTTATSRRGEADAAQIASVGNNITAANAGWTFGGQTPNHFADHVRRSIPMYAEGHKLACELSDYFVQDGTACYELGSSVGELIAKVATRHAAHQNVRWVGIDSVEAMTLKAREEHGHLGIEFVTSDILRFAFERANLFLSYYTIQFTPLAVRAQLIRKLYDSLLPGGGLIMFEKVRGSDPVAQDLLSSLYVDFKIEQGFHPAEIIAKSKSLKGILNPQTSEENVRALRDAGFSSVFTVMRYLSFVGYLAIK